MVNLKKIKNILKDIIIVITTTIICILVFYTGSVLINLIVQYMHINKVSEFLMFMSYGLFYAFYSNVVITIVYNKLYNVGVL